MAYTNSGIQLGLIFALPYASTYSSMDGLQLDDSSREKMVVSQNSHNLIAQHGYSTNPTYSTATSKPHYIPTNQQEAQLPDVSRRRLLPWGFSLLGYTILIAGITAVIMGAALGGGLGGAIAVVANSKKPS